MTLPKCASRSTLLRLSLLPPWSHPSPSLPPRLLCPQQIGMPPKHGTRLLVRSRCPRRTVCGLRTFLKSPLGSSGHFRPRVACFGTTEPAHMEAVVGALPSTCSHSGHPALVDCIAPHLEAIPAHVSYFRDASYYETYATPQYHRCARFGVVASGVYRGVPSQRRKDQI